MTKGPTTGDVAERPARTAEKLLVEAAALFRQRGYGAATTRELSTRLGINKASLYHHIASKEDLLYALCVESLRRLTDDLSRVASESPPEDRLRRIVTQHLVGLLENRDMHLVALIELRALSDERQRDIVRRRNEYAALMRTAIEDDQAAGRLRRDIDARVLSLGLLSLVNWTLFWFNPAGDLEPTQLGELFASIYLDGAATDMTDSGRRPE